MTFEQKKEFVAIYKNIEKCLKKIELLMVKGKEQIRKIRRMYNFNQTPSDKDAKRALIKMKEIIDEIDSYDDALRFIHISYMKREEDLERSENEFMSFTLKEMCLSLASDGEKLINSLDETVKLVLPELSDMLNKLDDKYF